jgi:glucokinase
MFLAGDIGGTKTNLAVYAYHDGVLVAQRVASFPSKDHATLGEILRAFLGDESSIRHACFGVAGPVKDGRVQVTNLPWVVDAAALQAELHFQQVSLLNDLEANAFGIATLQPSELVSINPEANLMQVGNRALIAAGTGLGEAGLMWDGVTHRPFSSEGGHSSFAPNDPIGDELLVFLRRELLGHVSWERVLSGMGMRNLYRFFRQRSGQPEPAWLTEQLVTGDFAAVVTNAGLANQDPVCVDAVDCFIRNYGAEAGNLGLKILALGGIYIGGGIAPKMMAKMQSPVFLDAFNHKGRMSPLLRSTPVHVIMNDKTALQGAAWFAAHLA